MGQRSNWKCAKVLSISGCAILPKTRRGKTGEEVRRQGFRDSPSLAQHQASQGWGLVFGAALSLGLCFGCILSQWILSALSQWVFHCHFTDEETEAWGDAMRSQEPPQLPAPPHTKGHNVGVMPKTTPVLPVLPSVLPSGNGFLQSQAPPPPCSCSWLRAHLSALPIHLLLLPGRASGPYVT